MALKVYNYDRNTKFYVGVSDADNSPLEPGKYLIPAHATVIPVPSFTVNQRARFDEAYQSWFVEDIPLPPEPPVPTPEEVKASLLEWLELRADFIKDRLAKGYIVAQAEGDTVTVQDLKTKWLACKAKYVEYKQAINGGATEVPDDFPL
jgi:hypothetical protein